MTRDLPRRPVSSRTPTSRPRRIAGRGTGVGQGPEVDAEATQAEVDAVETVEAAEPVETAAPAETADADEAETLTDTGGERQGADSPPRGMGTLFASPRTTQVLIGIAAVLALVAVGLGIWLWQHEPDSVAAPRASKSDGPIAVPEDRPVLISAADAQEAVAAGAEAASTIVATSYEDYDEQVEEAAALMTEDFAAEYRQTASDVRQQILDTKTEVQVTIVAQGVVRANTVEVEALLFLNQYSSKDGGETTYTPYRALVTVVNTDTGWLVSGLDTQ